jgi:hypothetical protein
VTPWPRIAEPELLRRLAFGDDEFLAFALQFAGSVPPRELTEELYRHALAYPWARPASSFLLRGEQAQPLDELAPADRERALRMASGDRHPLLAFGANGAPERLALKFTSLPDEERELLVLAGHLHDFDVGAAPFPTFYGALPATLFPSPGARVRASLLFASDAQLTALAWSELTYYLGRLDGVRFEPDAADAGPVTGLYGFVSRWGALCVDDEIVAMAAVPAAERSAPALSQEQLLDHVAASVFGDGAGARELVGAVMEDFGATAQRIADRLLGSVRHFESMHWTRYVQAG